MIRKPKSLEKVHSLAKLILDHSGRENTIEFILDGCNVATTNRRDSSFKRIELVVSTLEEVGSVAVFVSATLRHYIDEPKKLYSWKKSGKLFTAPARTHDDLYILETAHKFGSIVVSNDKFEEYQEFYPEEIENTIKFMIVPKEGELNVIMPIFEFLKKEIHAQRESKKGELVGLVKSKGEKEALGLN